MQFDTRSLLIVDLVTVLTMASALEFYRWHQRTYPGFTFWIRGTWVMGIGFLAMMLRDVAPPLPGIFVTNAAFMAAAVMRWDGTVRFTNDRTLPRWVYLVPLVFACLCVWPAYVAASDARRGFLSGLGVAIPSVAIGVQFLRHSPTARAIPYRVIGFLHFVFAAAVVSRGLIWLANPTVHLLDTNAFHSAFFITITAFEVTWGIAFTMMNANRLEAELLETQRRLSTTIEELQAAQGEVKTLSGLLPVCCSCKRIRDDAGYWNQLEEYLHVHSGIQFSHGICPECAARLYPEFVKPPSAAK